MTRDICKTNPWKMRHPDLNYLFDLVCIQRGPFIIYGLSSI